MADGGFAVEAGETFELELSLLGQYDSQNYISWSFEESSDSYTMKDNIAFCPIVSGADFSAYGQPAVILIIFRHHIDGFKDFKSGLI